MSQPQFRVDPLAGARAGLRWLRNPVSIDGAASLPKLSFAVGGPGLYKKVEAMRAHTDGSRVLADRPDLGATLADLDSLSRLPEGSFGRAYHSFMSTPQAVPDYLLAALMSRGGEWDRLDWNDDMRFLFERLSHTHDLTHVLSGYGTHLASEAVNIGFVIGLEGAPTAAALAFSAASNAVLWPTIGARTWQGHVMHAFRRGQSAARIRPFAFTYFEELFPEPLEEVRHQWGIEPLERALDTSEWLGNPLAKRMANGFSETPDPTAKATFLALADQLVKSGVEVKVLVNLDDATMGEVARLAQEGATVEELRDLVSGRAA